MDLQLYHVKNTSHTGLAWSLPFADKLMEGICTALWSYFKTQKSNNDEFLTNQKLKFLLFDALESNYLFKLSFYFLKKLKSIYAYTDMSVF